MSLDTLISSNNMVNNAGVLIFRQHLTFNHIFSERVKFLMTLAVLMHSCFREEFKITSFLITYSMRNMLF